MITSSPTFCPAPWTSLNIDQTGRVMPCMHSTAVTGNIKKTSIQEIIHGPIYMDIRQHMADGKWHSACVWCKQLEETTGVSGRTVRRTSPESLAAIDRDINWFTLEHIVVNWSNLCNLTCVYCNDETSTAWQSIRGIPINHVKNEHQDLIELAKQHGKSVQGLVLGGGEPLLQKGLLEFLKHIDSEKVRVLVTTNLSMDISRNKIYQELKTWPNVDWQISFDNANKDKFEYVRNGAHWHQFVTNIDLMKSEAQHVIAHPAYSIYCAFDLIEYYEFCENKNLEIFWCELQHPWPLDARRLPLPLRQEAINEIDRVNEQWGQRQGLAIDTLLRYKKQLLDNAFLTNIDQYMDVLGFHREREQELAQTKTFTELWPNIVRGLK